MNWLDLKLGGRMLVKYPGLTIVGGLAMAFAIWVGIVIFQVAGLFVHPALPLPQGARLYWLRDRHAGRLHAGLRRADTPRAQY